MQVPNTWQAPGPMAASPVGNITGWRRHYMLLILLLVYASSMVDRQIMGVLIQPIKEEMQVSDAALGLLTGLAFALFYCIMAVPFGRLSDRSNRRNLVAWCCLAWSGATALCGMAIGYWSLVSARVAVAVGEAGGTAPSTSMIADLYPPAQRSRAMSVFMLAPHLGTLLGLGLGAWIAQKYGWRHAFFWVAVPGILFALLLRFTCKEPVRGLYERGEQAAKAAAAVTSQTQERFGVVLRGLWANKSYVGVALGGMLLSFSGYAIGMWNVPFFVRSHGLQLKDAGILMGAIGGFSAIAGALFSGWLTDLMAKRHTGWQLGVPMLGTLAAVPFGVLFYMAPAGVGWTVAGIEVPSAMALMLGFSVFSSFWAAPAYAVLANVLPGTRMATSMAIYNLMLTAIGGGFGPLAVGMLSDALTPAMGQESLRWALCCMLVFYVIAALIFAATVRPYIRHMNAKVA